MLSIRGRIALTVVKAVLNVNPDKNDHVIKSMKDFTKMGSFRMPKGYVMEKLSADGVPIELFKKKDENPEKLIYIIHGGAFIGGMSNMYRKNCLPYSKAGHGAAVVNIDYRTAPDHEYPAAHDDVMKGWDFILRMGYKPENIILVGDSAGGNLTLSLLLKLRDEGRAMPGAAVVMSPWADLTASGASYRKNYNVDPMFGVKKDVPSDEKIEKLLAADIYCYCKNADRRDPYVSPVFGDYHGMPPMFVCVGSTELLLDDSLTVVQKIKDAGGDVELQIGERMFHVYPMMHAVIPEAKKTWTEILEFISAHT